FGFACGMNMVHGTLLVDPPAGADAPTAAASPPQEAGPPPSQARSASDEEAAAAAEPRAATADLARRVIIGALLTPPVPLGVMAHEVFGADWVPALLLNHWWQLALITPVMFYAGWPIHRSGWGAIAAHSAEMNSLITLGTLAAYGFSTVVTVAPGLLPADLRD